MMIELDVYDADRDIHVGVPLRALRRTHVVAPEGSTVAELLQAAGHQGYNSFSFVTQAIERDVGLDEIERVVSAHTLLGIDMDGLVYYQGEKHVLWEDLLRARDAHLYRGERQRIVVYPDGVAGGPSPDGLWAMVEWLFDGHGITYQLAAAVGAISVSAGPVVKASRWVSESRKKQIAQQWRRQGFTAAGIRDYLQRLPQWDSEQFAVQTRITPLEACLALVKAGYERSPDGLWRLGASEEGAKFALRVAQLEAEALAEMERSL